MAGKTAPQATPTEPQKPTESTAKPVQVKPVEAKPEVKPAPEAKPEVKPVEVKPATPEVEPEAKPTLLQDEHIVRPQGDLVLTVKVKQLLFFGVSGREVKVLKGDKVVDRIVTDKSGEAFFKLPAGEYKVVTGENSIPIDLQKHSTLRMK